MLAHRAAEAAKTPIEGAKAARIPTPRPHGENIVDVNRAHLCFEIGEEAGRHVVQHADMKRRPIIALRRPQTRVGVAVDALEVGDERVRRENRFVRAALRAEEGRGAAPGGVVVRKRHESQPRFRAARMKV